MKLNKTLKNIFCLSAIPLCVLPVISCSCSKKPTPVPPGPEPELKAEIILEKTSLFLGFSRTFFIYYFYFKLLLSKFVLIQNLCQQPKL